MKAIIKENSDYTGTYSPEDNKLRLYAAYRLDTELYSEAKSAGFRYAPKQELFFAHWSPRAEDFLLSLADSINDEDTSLVERSEQRAERFDGYQENRLNDANNAHSEAKGLADGIPFGQPILVGHHSEKRARKQAEKIERGFKKAVSMWNTAKYWELRAKGALHHAKYLEKPEVRARRIKKLEAENRKYNKYIKEAEQFSKFWNKDGLTWDRARSIANHDSISKCYSVEQYPRPESASQYEGSMGLWSALDGIITAKQAKEIALKAHTRSIAWYSRLISHNDNRLTYEKTMLEDQGGSDLLKPKARPKLLPILNYKTDEPIVIKNPRYYAEEYQYLDQISLTRAEFNKIHKDARGVIKVNGTHRIKYTTVRYVGKQKEGESSLDWLNRQHGRIAIFITDAKTHTKPE